MSVWRGRGVGMLVWEIRNDRVNLTIIESRKYENVHVFLLSMNMHLQDIVRNLIT